MRNFFRIAVVAAYLPVAAYAARPLITDDTGTQGRGNNQFQAGVEYTSDRADGVYTRETSFHTELAYGLQDALDVAVSLPWISRRIDDGTVSMVRGVGDAAVDLKWRFFERGDLGVALKPGLRVPTGDESRALGAGRLGHRSSVVASFARAPWALHFQAEYLRNRNKLDERAGIHQTSLAVVHELNPQLKLALDIGTATNPDKASDEHRRFLLVGAIYAVSRSVDVDLGYKRGVSSPETDREAVAGFTVRF